MNSFLHTLSDKSKHLSKLLLASTICATIALSSGCSWLQVYKIDIPQGNPVSLSNLNNLSVGMTQKEVLLLLGSPTFVDTLYTNRWDYIYTYKAGTFGKREGKSNISKNQRHLQIYFDTNNKISRIVGKENFLQ